MKKALLVLCIMLWSAEVMAQGMIVSFGNAEYNTPQTYKFTLYDTPGYWVCSTNEPLWIYETGSVAGNDVGAWVFRETSLLPPPPVVMSGSPAMQCFDLDIGGHIQGGRYVLISNNTYNLDGTTVFVCVEGWCERRNQCQEKE